MIKVFGIRHHGAGSAKSLGKALEQFAPDCVLIESPADAESIIDFATDKKIELPIAILIYNDTNLKQASYLPFASFSPEWVAIQFGLENDLPVRFMDLPFAYQFALETKEASEHQIEFEKVTAEKKMGTNHDPIGQFAALAGYSDAERWWEITFEQVLNPIEIFDQIEAMMVAFRINQIEQRTETLRREAYMRTVIRQAIKDGFEKIAVICGAYHVPALVGYHQFKATADKSFLKGIKKVKTKATWIAWSYERLAFDSGYGAGIKSPAWYELLFKYEGNASIYWMSKVSQLLREEGMDASAAHAVEAVRLAETLATLRQMELPGIEELRESAVTIFGNGNEEPLRWIERRLIIGEKYGSIPEGIPAVPLQKDLEKAIKTARLTKERNSIDRVEKKFDLRKPTHLFASKLLHRLRILDIRWGEISQGSQFAKGSFSEHWVLKWLPDFAILVIEAGMWGNTMEEAATQKLLSQAKSTDVLSDLSEYVADGLLANLPRAIPFLIVRLRDVTALTEDALHLLEAMPPLVQMLRYGTVRKIDAEEIRTLVEAFIPRLCIGLPTSCLSADEDSSKDIFKKITIANHAFSILNEPELQKYWTIALRQIVDTPSIHPILKGACVRILFEKKIYSTQQATTQMRYALSLANEAQESATWLEGFLHGSGLLLIHNLSLWNILDDWIADIPMEVFKSILPLLRRTFSNFPPAERQKMLMLAKTKSNETKRNETNTTLQEIEPLLPIIRTILN